MVAGIALIRSLSFAFCRALEVSEFVAFGSGVVTLRVKDTLSVLVATMSVVIVGHSGTVVGYFWF